MKKAVLLGNPNVGKSVIFNALTGLGVEISNYPGTTVTMQTGPVKFGGDAFTITDLPGVYSLAGDSVEERMVREYLAQENPDLYVVVLDSTTVERNLFLLLQVADFRKPMVIVLNMSDDAEKEGIVIDVEKLSALFGVPVIKTVATEGENLEAVADAIVKGGIPPAKSATRLDEHILAAKNSLQDFADITDGEALSRMRNAGDRDAVDRQKGDNAAADVHKRAETLHVRDLCAYDVTRQQRFDMMQNAVSLRLAP